MKTLSTLGLALCISLSAFAGGKDKPKYKSKPVKNPQTVTTSSGLQYTITSQGDGPMPQAGDMIVAHYTGKLTNDTVFDSSVKRNEPFRFKLGQGQVIKGWDEGFGLLHAGDKAILRIPPQLGYGKSANGKIPANSELIFEVELLDILPAAKQWVLKSKDTVTTASGLKYIWVQKNPKGAPATNYSTVKVDYSGFFVDGKKFDSSIDNGKPIEFLLGMHMVIPGWEEGLLQMHVGEKMKMIIPPSLGYGAQQRGPIPANSTLIFDVELQGVTANAVPVMYDTTGVKPLVTQSGVKVYIVKKGAGTKADNGKVLLVQYTGFLSKDNIFDSSILRGGKAYSVTCGAGGVIKGWDEALALGHEGDQMLLVIPSDAGYGDAGRAPIIPPKATLYFNVDISSVK